MLMNVERVELSDHLEKLMIQLSATNVVFFDSVQKNYAVHEGFDKNIWLEYKNINQPLILTDSVIVPVFRSNCIRAIIYLEKKNPSSNDAMYVLTWLINNIDFLESFVNDASIAELNLTTNQDYKISGVACSPGIAMGKIVVLDQLYVPELRADEVCDYESEVSRLTVAVKAVCDEMQYIEGVLLSNVQNAPVELFDAYCAMLDRHGIVHDASKIMHEQSFGAEHAVQEIIKSYSEKLQHSSDPYMRARAIDIKDIGNRILIALNPGQKHKINYPNRTILFADELSPLSVAEIPLDNLVGLVCRRGSKYSHASILSRAIGVPYVINAKCSNVTGLTDKTAIIDGYSGLVHVNPPEDVRRSLKDSLAYEDLLDKKFQDVREKTSETGDGSQLELNVNVGLGSDLKGAFKNAADGVGLFRTELPFMLNNHLPSVDLQQEMYAQILKTFHPRKVVVRTLDIGGDKRLPYFLRQETNPYLGARGIRFSCEFPSVFRMQVEAVIKANEGLHNARIMLPMVTTMDEVIYAREIMVGIANDLGCSKLPELGVMVEVPSIISELELLSDFVDFFSVGTNDLTQYLLAVDRNNSKVAHLYDSWHPSVLSSLYEILMICRSQKRPVSVCGELSSDPMGALLLVAMGFKSLSMNHSSLLKVKWLLRQFTDAELSCLWWEVFDGLSHGTAHKIVSKALISRDLGHFVSKK